MGLNSATPIQQIAEAMKSDLEDLRTVEKLGNSLQLPEIGITEIILGRKGRN